MRAYLDVSVASRSDFDESTDTVTVIANNDKTGYDINAVDGNAVTGADDFKADVSGVSTFNSATDTVKANLTQIDGSTTVDNVSITVWARRIFIAMIRPFTASATTRSKAYEDNTGATEFTHEFDANNSRELL